MATPDPLIDAVLPPVIDTTKGSNEVYIKDPVLLDVAVSVKSGAPQVFTRFVVFITGLALFIITSKYARPD